MTPRGLAQPRLLLAATALSIAVFCAPWLEASMFYHMLVQLPLLLAGGLLAAHALPAHALVAKADQYGMTGLSSLLFVTAYWMIPRALEQSLTSDWVDTAKMASLFLLGLM